jgi:hypothetical protein
MQRLHRRRLTKEIWVVGLHKEQKPNYEEQENRVEIKKIVPAQRVGFKFKLTKSEEENRRGTRNKPKSSSKDIHKAVKSLFVFQKCRACWRTSLDVYGKSHLALQLER